MYDKIYEYWKKEKDEQRLQSIDKSFYDDLDNYIDQLRKHLENIDRNTIGAKLTGAELARTQKLSEELVDMRIRKILGVIKAETELEALSHIVVGREKAIFEKLLETSKQYQLMVQMVSGGGEVHLAPGEVMAEPKRVLVRLLTGIPAIVGVDTKSYGPFKSEDLATLPLENAEILVRGKAAVRVGYE